MGAVLVVDTREENVALSVCVGVMQGSRRGAKNSVLAARRRGFTEAAAAEEKVPGGVERRARVRRDMGSVSPESRGGVAGRLGAEGRALSRRELVVELERAHVRRVDKAVLRQTQVSVLHLARRVMPGEGAQPGELVTGIQEHYFGGETFLNQRAATVKQVL